MSRQLMQIQIKVLQIFAGVIGCVLVLTSAWLSHGQAHLLPAQFSALVTALLFAFIHLLAIFIVVLLFLQTSNKQYLLGGFLFAFGIVTFSGMIFIKTLFVQVSWLGKLPPIGGIAFAIGWLLLGLANNTFNQSTKT